MSRLRLTLALLSIVVLAALAAFTLDRARVLDPIVLGDAAVAHHEVADARITPPPHVEVPEAAPVRPAPTPVPAPPRLRYVPHPSEAQPELKQAAAHFVEDLLTHDASATPASRARELAAQHGLDAAGLELQLGELIRSGGVAVAHVIYPQLGGLEATTASAMVFVEQTTILPDGTVVRETRTMDVRLALEGRWRVTALASNGGPRVPRPPDLPAQAAAVVDHPRITMPDTARWDVYRGAIDPALLQRMLDIAERHRYGVNVLQTGHPPTIFGTQRESAHNDGLAVDVFEVDGRLVIDDRAEGSVTHGLARWLVDDGIHKLGGPWALYGDGGRSFTDALHQDHLHIAVGAP